jgi:predicted nucleotidyltransferase
VPLNHPFATIAEFAAACGKDWSAYALATKATSEAEQKLQSALTSKLGTGPPFGGDSALILFGSFARHEMTPGSDYDWTLLIDGVVDNQHADQARFIQASLQAASLIEPGSSGTFGSLMFSHDLVHRIGGGADSNANLTRRMLMLLESRPFDIGGRTSSQLIWNNVIANILERYFEQEVHFSASGRCRVPRFLLNDLTRYWRTICVDYAAKHREQDGRKWAMRNAKLRLSRKLIYASGLAFCLSCELNPPQDDGGLFGITDAENPRPFIESAHRFASTPSLDYLAKFIATFVEDEARRLRIADLVFGSYNEWLLRISDEDFRKALDKLDHSETSGCVEFQEIRKLGTDFANGLKLLFFNRESDPDKLINLSLDYVGF